MSKSVVFYLPDGFADWEGAFLMAELREANRAMITVSDDGKMVTSFGGLKVQPDLALNDIRTEDVDAFIVIGSDGWRDPRQNEKALLKAAEFQKKGVLVGGICGATSAFARVGLLNGKRHTSNSADSLNRHPQYTGADDYVEKPAVIDGCLVTASGFAPLEFTLEILKFLKVYSDEKCMQWYALYKNGVQPPAEYWG